MPDGRIDDAVLRLLRQQVRFGQGRNPADYALELVGSRDARAQLAREAAQKAIVLLKNEGNLLPLHKSQAHWP